MKKYQRRRIALTNSSREIPALPRMPLVMPRFNSLWSGTENSLTPFFAITMWLPPVRGI